MENVVLEVYKNVEIKFVHSNNKIRAEVGHRYMDFDTVAKAREHVDYCIEEDLVSARQDEFDSDDNSVDNIFYTDKYEDYNYLILGFIKKNIAYDEDCRVITDPNVKIFEFNLKDEMIIDKYMDSLSPEQFKMEVVMDKLGETLDIEDIVEMFLSYNKEHHSGNMSFEGKVLVSRTKNYDIFYDKINDKIVKTDYNGRFYCMDNKEIFSTHFFDYIIYLQSKGDIARVDLNKKKVSVMESYPDGICVDGVKLGDLALSFLSFVTREQILIFNRIVEEYNQFKVNKRLEFESILKQLTPIIL